jgi:hypothetical protein
VSVTEAGGRGTAPASTSSITLEDVMLVLLATLLASPALAGDCPLPEGPLVAAADGARVEVAGGVHRVGSPKGRSDFIHLLKTCERHKAAAAFNIWREREGAERQGWAARFVCEMAEKKDCTPQPEQLVVAGRDILLSDEMLDDLPEEEEDVMSMVADR